MRFARHHEYIVVAQADGTVGLSPRTVAVVMADAPTAAATLIAQANAPTHALDALRLIAKSSTEVSTLAIARNAIAQAEQTQ